MLSKMLTRGLSPCAYVYPTGGHGWGMRSSFKYHIEMLLELKVWLQSF